MKATSSPDTDTLFAATPILRNHLLHVQTTLARQMNSTASLLKPLGGALRTHGTQKTLVNAIQRTTHKQLMDNHADNLHPEAMKSLTWRVLTCRVENGVVGSQSRRGGLEIWLRNIRRFPFISHRVKVPAQFG